MDITPVNDNPIAVADGFTVNEDQTLETTLGLNDLLQNDSDVDGDTLTVNTVPISGPSNGSLTLNSDGTFTYTPDADFSGSDSFTYEVTDGNGGRAQAVVNLTVTPVNDSPSILLTDLITSLEENTNTTDSVRVANITIADDNIGVNDLSLTGADASNFKIVGDELHIVAGTNLDFESVSKLDVTVQVDDPTIGSTVEDSVAYTLNVADVNESPSISLENVVQTFPFGIGLESGIKVADIVISDDALGTEMLQLTGADADLFEIVGNELRLISTEGVAFNRTTLSVAIQVDDASIGQTFDDLVDLQIETDQLGNNIPNQTDPNPNPEPEPEPETAADEESEQDMMSEDDGDSTQLQEIVATPVQTTTLNGDSMDPTVATQESEQQAILATVEPTQVTDLNVQEASEQTSNLKIAEYGALVQRVVGDTVLTIPTANQFAASGTALTINQFGELIESTSGSMLSLDKVVVGSSAIATTSLSVGYVIWMLRGGSLLASFVSSLPAWSSFDLLPVLNKFDEESLADIADN